MKTIALRLTMLALLYSTLHARAQDNNQAIYSEVIPTTSGLPFNPATDIQESFLAPNGRQVSVMVKGPVGSGTYSRAIEPGETPDQYFPALLAEAVKAKAHHVVVPKGVYAFRGPTLCTDKENPDCNLPTSCNTSTYYNCNPLWTIGQYPQGQVTEPNSIADLDIDFSGSELDFSAPVIGIWILEAQRLRLRNFTVDWPSLPIASVGTIQADPDNKGHHALVLDPQYPVTDKYQGGTVQIQAVDIWDDGKHTDDPPGTFDAKSNNDYEEYFIFGNAPQPTYVGNHTFSCKSCNFQNSATDPSCSFFNGCANFDIFAIGTRVIVRHYTYNGFAFLVNWSNDIDFENVKLRTGPGIGFSVSSEGGYRGFRIANSEIERGKGRLISTASDAIDISMQSDIIVEDNNIGYQGDDSLSIYPTTSTLTSVNGTHVEIPTVCDPDPMDQPLAGDVLAFFDTNYVYLGTAHVVAAQGAFCGGTLSLTLDHAIKGLDATGNLNDLTQQPSARYLIRNNIAHECRCHGILVDAPYGSIDHNAYFRNSAGAVALDAGAGSGPAATNLAITGNVFRRPGQSAQYLGAVSAIAQTADGTVIASPVYRKIDISNNTIENTPGPAMVITSADDFSISRNQIINTNQTQADPEQYGALPTLDSILVYESSQASICGNEEYGPTAGPVGIDPTTTRVIAEPICPEGPAGDSTRPSLNVPMR